VGRAPAAGLTGAGMAVLILLGAAGLVGRSVLAQALADARVTRVVAPTRRPLFSHARLENPVVDFDALPEKASWWRADAVICMLGATMRKAGSQAAFRRVDHDYPLAAARLARAQGAPTFVLNSAVGANAHSRVFYNRVKGEVEEALAALGFPSLVLVRPSLIGGERDEVRPAERLAQKVLGLAPFLLPPRYRLVPHERLARALLDAALRPPPGRTVIESEAIG